MFELLIELYSEEIPPNLQISARTQIEKLIIKELNNLKLNYKDLKVYSTPTRLSLFVKNLPSKIKISASEIKGPKVGVPQNIVESFAKSKKINLKDLFEKELDKGRFYFAKIDDKEISCHEELIKFLGKNQ